MTETDSVTSIGEVLDGYFAMWNEADPARRRRIIEETWTQDASYVEPLMAVEGYDALNAGVAGLQAQFPGHELRPAGKVDAHHDRVRWSWELFGPEGGTAAAAGTNVGALAPDGRLRQVTGFFDHTAGVA
ncbi:MAG: nuclear transport factor 2 family protein [Chloroflexi bacterium]|nr:nuclear transport factor 2 family protein [Chloroflexota bacterium]